MGDQETDQGQDIHAEFFNPLFAQHYEAIADTFIDTKGAAASLKKLLSPDSSIFEIGMGTGYFAQELADDGYHMVGSQFDDLMYKRLEAEHPDLDVVSHERIETYQFDRSYDAIVSHSSIFLFTRPDTTTAQQIGTDLIFQSFNTDGEISYEALDKVMGALNPGGGLYINIQPNAQRSAPFVPNMTFEMYSCDYDFDQHLVEKAFGFVVDGEDKPFPDTDRSYVQKWDEFLASIDERGYTAEVSDDGYWVIVKNKQQKPVDESQSLRREASTV